MLFSHILGRLLRVNNSLGTSREHVKFGRDSWDCPGLMGIRLPIPAVGSILPMAQEVRHTDVVAAPVIAFRVLQSQ